MCCSWAVARDHIFLFLSSLLFHIICFQSTREENRAGGSQPLWNIHGEPGAMSVTCVPKEQFPPSFLRRQHTLKLCGIAQGEESIKTRSFFWSCLTHASMCLFPLYRGQHYSLVMYPVHRSVAKNIDFGIFLTGILL